MLNNKQKHVKVLFCVLIITCFLIINPVISKSSSPGSLSVQPGQSDEACMNLAPGQTFSYSFKSTKPLYFDIHYHDSMDYKFFPVKKDGIIEDSGSFDPDTKTTYCMMWTNNQNGQVEINYDYSVIKKH
jgi:hypothetical protein